MLKNEYPLDRSVNENGVEDYLLSLKAVGLIELTSVTSDKSGKLKQCYKITDYGASRMKYISQIRILITHMVPQPMKQQKQRPLCDVRKGLCFYRSNRKPLMMTMIVLPYAER